MIAEMMMNMREGLLAVATGAVAGGFANFFILRRTWLNAQALGDRSDGYVVELRKLHGKYDDVQREPRMEMPSLLDLRLRRDLSNAWNSWVVGFHAEASRWL
eukprot:jgi/Chrpa1/17230/Chrysochromulina_OHIO_Genome00022837-RA